MQPSELSPLQLFASLTAEQQTKALRAAARASRLSVNELKAQLIRDWRVVGRPKQQPPPGLWTFWLLMSGRGFGKTLTGAQWAKRVALEDMPGCRFALVAPTLGDVRSTMVEGETGLLSVLPVEALRGQSLSTAWNRGVGELFLANGTQFRAFSSEKPDRLRGPQHHAGWGEEVASWKDAHRGDVLETTWSNFKLGCRLGDNPRICLTTTPKPNKLVKALLAIPRDRLMLVTGSSYENRENLSEAWWREVVEPYEGTRVGQQEILGMVLEDVEGALWTQALIDSLRVPSAPELSMVFVGVDPNASDEEASNEAGIVVAGRDSEWHGFVLADRTTVKGGPRAWAQAAVDAYHDYDADKIVAEKNNGGEMVRIMIQTVDPAVPVELVTASRGKRTRAEPIASLYEKTKDGEPAGEVHHVGSFPLLEEQMTTWTPDSESPDRMDALVWALTKLLIGRRPVKARTSVPRGRIPGVGTGTAGQGVYG